MAKRNLTVQLEEDVIRQIKAIAAKRGTSVSGLVTREIQKLSAADERYEEARRYEFEALDNATNRGGVTWRREDLYDR